MIAKLKNKSNYLNKVMGQLCANATTITKATVSIEPAVLYPTKKQFKERNDIFNFRPRSNSRQ